MSVEKQEVPQLSLLDQLKLQRAQFNAQKDLTQNNLNQLVGAVFACDEMIKKHEEAEATKGLSRENLGDTSNGETDKPEQKKIAAEEKGEIEPFSETAIMD